MAVRTCSQTVQGRVRQALHERFSSELGLLTALYPPCWRRGQAPTTAPGSRVPNAGKDAGIAGEDARSTGLLDYIFAMAISKDLLEILVCPVCKAALDLKSDQSGLKCVECHRVYPIRDDIPVMLVDEARIEE